MRLGEQVAAAEVVDGQEDSLEVVPPDHRGNVVGGLPHGPSCSSSSSSGPGAAEPGRRGRQVRVNVDAASKDHDGVVRWNALECARVGHKWGFGAPAGLRRAGLTAWERGAGKGARGRGGRRCRSHEQQARRFRAHLGRRGPRAGEGLSALRLLGRAGRRLRPDERLRAGRGAVSAAETAGVRARIVPASRRCGGRGRREGCGLSCRGDGNQRRGNRGGRAVHVAFALVRRLRRVLRPAPVSETVDLRCKHEETPPLDRTPTVAPPRHPPAPERGEQP